MKSEDALILSWRRFLDGEDEGFAEIVRETSDSLLYFVLGLVKNSWIAEDIVSDTFAELIFRRKRFRGDSALKTYLFAIGRNRAIDYIRKTSRELSVPDFTAEAASDSETLEARIITGERNRQLHAAMGELCEDYRQVLYLVYFEDMSAEAAARVMKRSRKQTENLIYRAKKALRAILEADGFEL